MKNYVIMQLFENVCAHLCTHTHKERKSAINYLQFSKYGIKLKAKTDGTNN